MSLEKEVITEVKLKDSNGEELEFGDRVIYRTRDNRDILAKLVGYEEGLIVLSNVTNEKEYRIRINTIEFIEVADKF